MTNRTLDRQVRLAEGDSVSRCVGSRSAIVALGLALLLGPAVARAAPSDEQLLRGADARIEKYRKADASVTVVDAKGAPIPGAEVEIQQTRHEFLFGCNIFLWGRAGKEQDEAAYRRRFAALLNYATLPFYWPSYERRQGQPDHERAAGIAQWCRRHGIATKGHPLAWNFSDPAWLPDDPERIRRLQLARIDDCVGRFKGLIDRWDVVNEAAHFDREAFKKRAPKMTRMWQTVGQIELVRQCFRRARRANPAATLLINDYRLDAAYENVIRQLVGEDGKPLFDVIGMQSHMHGGPWTNGKIWDACEQFAKYGVPLHFTETTILSARPKPRGAGSARRWASTKEGEQWQARETARFYTMLFSHPAVEAITWWDFSDRRAWQNAPAGWLREDMSPKPVYERMQSLIKGKWWTRETLQANRQGQAAFRGFLGQYKVTVAVDGKPTAQEMTVARNQPNRLVVTIGGSH